MKRSNAARLGFIVFMVLGTLMNFASIALLIAALDWVNAIGASIDEAGVTQQIRASNMVSMAMGVVSALAIAGLHGWIIWKPVSYTHLDVYKRQALDAPTTVFDAGRQRMAFVLSLIHI